MKVLHALRDRLRSLHFGFFWRLILAFALIAILAGGGMTLAGRTILRSLESTEAQPAASDLWVDRLAEYYADQGSWTGVDALIASYPCGEDWAPWDESWQLPYALTSVDGIILTASDETRIGQTLRRWESALAVPVVVDDQPVGSLFLSPFEFEEGDYPSPQTTVQLAIERLLIAGLVIISSSLIVGLLFSRRISQPLSNMTTAARSVASGDLNVRVPTQYPGELGELASAFNQMSAALARADDLRRNMTADVAHELRTPLSVIRGKLEGVLDGVYPANPEHLEPVLQEIGLLTQLVEDLRLLAMAEAGQLALEKQSVDVGDLLRDAQVNFGPQAADRGVTLALDLPATLPPVMADRRRIAQILGNLITNALRHTPQGGCVTLSAAVVESDVEVAVADSGSGIAPEDLPYIFERFWRGEKSRSRASGGTGLGLAITKQLVALHRGSIRVESALGKGSTFRFTLPAA
jgi:two-component system OmpR family sensor kinase/two-component system sensor histidine kinase BaeS